MSSLESRLRADLATALAGLEKELEVLDARVQAEQDYPLWVWKLPREKDQSEYDHGRQQRLAVRQILTALDYQEGQAGNETRILPALVGAHPDTLVAVRAVNMAKARLDSALAAMRGQKIDTIDPLTGKTVRKPLDRVALAALGHVTLHKIRAVRQIVVVDEPLQAARYFWAHCRRITRLTREQAIERLQRNIQHQPSQAKQIDLVHAQQLPDGTALAEVRDAHPTPTVNFYVGSRNRPIKKTAVMPMFYPTHPGATLPDLGELPEEDTPPQRKPRRDSLIQPEVYLPTLHAHLYMDTTEECA